MPPLHQHQGAIPSDSFPGRKILKDVRMLATFIRAYCDHHHAETPRKRVTANGQTGRYLEDLEIHLCDECTKSLIHGTAKLILCPYNPKPRCKKCSTPCFSKGYRESMKRIMRFSGAHMIKRGRVDLLYKYLF